MDIWHWLFTICGLLLALIIIYVVLIRLRARKQRKDLEADIFLVAFLEAEKQRDPGSSLPLISLYEQILGRLRPKDDPIYYAMTLSALGNAYRNLPLGDRATNVEQAIKRYKEALCFLTPDGSPMEYANVQNDLGNAYRNLPTGDRAANVEQAIKCYQKALRFTPEKVPHEYVITQNDLGNAYHDLPTGDRAINLAQAIACYEEALRVATPETAPLDYALVQSNRGNVYRELPTGDRAANLAYAITCHQEALRFWTPETAPLEYARTQFNMGLAYDDLITGDRAENLARAITCYEEALRVWTPETVPLEYARAQQILGDAYRKLPTGDRAVNLAQAIACYQQVLRFRTAEAAPLEYAETQNNLGLAYSDLPTGDRAANLAQAIACYQQTLRFFTPETAPPEYARVQTSLGNTYLRLPTGDQGANLNKAMAYYREALQLLSPQGQPQEYAAIQNNLGLARSYLPASSSSDGESFGPTEPNLVLRSLIAQLPEKLQLDEVFSLYVFLSASPTPEARASLPIALPLNSTIDILVQPKRGVALEGASEGQLVISSEEETLPLQFKLRGVALGPGQLRVFAFHKGQPLGALTLTVTVLAASADATLPRQSYEQSLEPLRLRQPDLQLLILEHIEAGEPAITFRLTAQDPDLGLYLKPFGPIRLKVEPLQYFRDLFKDIENLPLNSSREKIIAEQRLAAKGTNLFKSLFPADLQVLLWSLRSHIQSVQVLSEEPWIPWELCKLFGLEDGRILEGPFLCEAFALARWFPGTSIKPSLHLNKMAIVVPSDSRLAFALDEQAYCCL